MKRIIVAISLLFVVGLSSGCNRTNDRVLPDGTKISGERTQKDGAEPRTPETRVKFIKAWISSADTQSWANGIDVSTGGEKSDLLIINCYKEHSEPVSHVVTSTDFALAMVREGFTNVLILRYPKGTTPNGSFSQDQMRYMGEVSKDGVKWQSRYSARPFLTAAEVATPRTPQTRTDFPSHWVSSEETKEWSRGTDASAVGTDARMLLIYVEDSDNFQPIRDVVSSPRFARIMVREGFKAVTLVQLPPGVHPDGTFNVRQVAYLGTVSPNGIKWITARYGRSLFTDVTG